MTPRASATRRVRVCALLLIAGLAAGPLATHVYWMLGGTWGLGGGELLDDGRARCGRRGPHCCSSPRCWSSWRGSGCGSRRSCPIAYSVLRLGAGGGLPARTVAAFTWSKGDSEWWLYGPASLVLGLLALVVAGSRRSVAHPQDAALTLTRT